MLHRVTSQFLSKFFCLTMPKNFVGEPFCVVFQKFPAAKKFTDKREGEVSRFSGENFLSHSAEKVRKATLQGVTNFGYRKVLCFRGLCHDFCRFSLSHSAEKFRSGTLLCCVSENLRQPKTLWIRGGGGCIKISSQKLLSHSADKRRRGTL